MANRLLKQGILRNMKEHMQGEDRSSVRSVASVFDRQEILRNTEDYTMEISPLDVISVASLLNMRQL